MLARFHEAIPTVKSIFSSKVLENKFRIFNRNNNFVTEITILPFFHKLRFLGSYIFDSNTNLIFKTSRITFIEMWFCSRRLVDQATRGIGLGFDGSSAGILDTTKSGSQM